MRYNVVSRNMQNGWKAGQKTDYLEYKSKILSEARLAKRLELLEKIPLQSLNDQKGNVDSILKVVLLASDQLPTSHRGQLENLKKKYTWLYIDYLDENCVINDYSRWVEKDILIESNNTHDILYSTFRLDDDDALSNNFIKNVYQYLKKEYIGFGVSFLEGYSAIFDSTKGIFTEFYDLRVLNLALGLGFVNFYAKNQGFHNKYITVYDLGNHSYIDRKVPVIVDGEHKSYIRTIYDGQDTLKSSLLKQIEGKKPISKEKISIDFPLINKIELISSISHINRNKNNHRFDLLSGKHTYSYIVDGVQLFFFANIKNNSDKLTVMLPGAVNRNKTIYNFQRFSWSDEIDGSVIIFLDPTVSLENEITIGWFQGDKDSYAMPILEGFIKNLIVHNDFKEENLTLFGSSAGGFTCLKLANAFLNSTIKVINPQTIVYNYSENEVSKLVSWIFPDNRAGLTEEQKDRLRVTLDLESRTQPIFYYQNKHDGHHLHKHLKPLLDAVSTELYSVVEQGEVCASILNIIYYNDAEKGHSPPSKEETLKWLNV